MVPSESAPVKKKLPDSDPEKMRNASRNETAGRLPATDGNFSRAARRDVRRKVRLATELGLYSVTAQGEVWTLRLSSSPTPTRASAAGLHAAETTEDARNAALSSRKRRSLDRAVRHRALCAKADALRARHLLKWWSKDCGDGPPPPPPPLPPGLPPSPPPPMTTMQQPPPPPPPQQQQEAKDDARASKEMRHRRLPWATRLRRHARSARCRSHPQGKRRCRRASCHRRRRLLMVCKLLPAEGPTSLARIRRAGSADAVKPPQSPPSDFTMEAGPTSPPGSL